jgi:lysophospholipase L1-like esterase
MTHVVLLGDSIFDNERYVPGGPPVVQQVQAALPSGSKATLFAVDGSVTTDVEAQLRKRPADATHLVVSVGGNDALGCIGLLGAEVAHVGGALVLLAEVLDEFEANYRTMLRAVAAARTPFAVCTVYDTIPDMAKHELRALALFNGVILREASRHGLPVIDLRVLCQDRADYSAVSPIEPSRVGGAKIAAAIARVVTAHDFTKPGCVLYGGGLTEPTWVAGGRS